MNFRLSISACALSVLLPVTAFAQSACPTRAMLENKGVRFESSLADEEIHRLASNGTIIQDIDYSGDKSQNVLGFGVHVGECLFALRYVEIDYEHGPY